MPRVPLFVAPASSHFYWPDAEAIQRLQTRRCWTARAMVPDVPIMTRPRTADEVMGQIAYDPTPLLVHVDVTDAFLTTELLGAIHGIGAEVYGNAFTGGDALALIAGDPGGYVDAFDRGIDVLQCEFPHWALMAIGR